jgi:short-subunit dehydrogenase
MTNPQYALVTGASEGLGKVFAEILAARRQRLVLVARSADKLEGLASELHNSYGIRAVPLPCDLAAPNAGKQLARRLADQELQISLLVNNAGFGTRGEFWKRSADECSEMMRLNVEAQVELTHELLPYMIQERRGGVINVASTAGFQPIPYAALYAATKSFVIAFSLGLAEELRPHGVSVVTLCPGRLQRNSQSESAKSRSRSFPGIYTLPKQVVTQALSALEDGGGLVVPGFLNKFAVLAQRLLPRRAVPRLVALMSR